jgi:UDP-glucose 4-epimerase
MIIFGDGTQTRDFTFVSDTANGILSAGIAEDAVGETINLGQGSEISINELAEHVGRVAGRQDAEVIHDEPRPGDVSRLYADLTRAKQLFGFGPRVNLDDGLRRLKAWYEESHRTPMDLLEEEVIHNWRPS